VLILRDQRLSICAVASSHRTADKIAGCAPRVRVKGNRESAARIVPSGRGRGKNF
jgi:hypothetical protein